MVSLNTRAQPLLYSSFVDYLELDPSVDPEQREVDGVQTDLSIQGSSFEQSLVLVNGLRIKYAQTGHHDLDIPIPLEGISRIEVLHGVGSTLYGADAMGGAINFITTRPSARDINYPSHHATAAWLGQCKNLIALRNRVGVTQRIGQGAYPVWDFAISRVQGRVRPYLEFSNLSNTGYEEIPGVAMPGRSVIGGAEIVFHRDATD